jgi:hypothetical protein
MERDLLEPYMAAYRQREPKRIRQPFADPRLAAIGAQRAAERGGWWQFLRLSPGLPIAAAAFALLLTLTPPTGEGGRPIAEQSVVASPLGAMSAPEDATVRSADLAAAEGGVQLDGGRLLLLATAGGSLGVAVRRWRRLAIVRRKED